MKKIALLIILSLFNLGLSQQSGKITFKFKKNKHFQKQLKNDNSQNSRKISEKVFSIAKDFNFILNFNPDESRYEWEEEMRDETIPLAFWNLAKNRGGGLSVAYQNRKDSLIMRQFKSPVTHQLYRDTSSLYKFNWKITQETDTILGFPVIKAVNGHLIAWFTPNIPVPFGPNDFGGLPGMILKIKNDYKLASLYELVAVKIKFYKKPIKIKKPKKGILRTEEEGRAARIKEMNR